MGERWKLGDVVVWFVTGNEQGGKTDADVFLNFYAGDGERIGWLKAYERTDMGGFEEGESNCGFIGNLNSQDWLKQLFDAGTRLDVKIDAEEKGDSGWYLESISLDFRVGPVVDVSTARTWHINEWIIPGAEPSAFDAEEDVNTGAGLFDEVGFDKELEIESGGAA